VLSERFMEDLINSEGLFCSILDRVKKDHTLMLAIRENNINIYYRGGSILKLYEKKSGSYTTFFDPKYSIFEKELPLLPEKIDTRTDAEQWVAAFPELKILMDEFLSVHSKTEREFQQLIARINNSSPVSNESEYFISDIEFAEPKNKPRFDMTAVRWLATDRKNGSKCKPALIELKYGDGAIDNKAGLLEHLQDMRELITNSDRYEKLLTTMESQFDQLDQLGLLKFNKGSSAAKIKLSTTETPEVIFILTNHNPRSSKLNKILTNPKLDQFDRSKLFDLKFFVASFSGYGLHKKCMLSLTEFREVLDSLMFK
jgi:hypothetical protein